MLPEKKLKILVIDDEPATLELFIFGLKQNGYDVVTANNGKNGITKAVQEKPDLIFLDIIMPEMDGFTVCEDLKKDNQTKNIPVVLFTAKSGTIDVEKGFKIGAADCIIKPPKWMNY
ncbi:MAG: response regulator [Elusimicrobiota bacterium]